VGPPVCGSFPPQFTIATSHSSDSAPAPWGVSGGCWHTRARLDIAIDDPTTDEQPDHVVFLGVSDERGSFNTANDRIEVCCARNGDTVTVSDEAGLTSTYVISNLTVTTLDDTNDTVSGRADPETRVAVLAAFHWPFGRVGGFRHVTADGSGQWTADFSVPGATGAESRQHDIRPGSSIAAIQINPDPPATYDGPLPFPIKFWGFFDQNWILRPLQPQSKNDCQHGRWVYVVDSAQNAFRNQRDCVRFVATGGQNPANGGLYP
jgi:hypothetical protein